MTTTVWDPAQYLRFADERTRPLRDLLARVPDLPTRGDERILDIGCGPGNSTAVLRERWPGARITGVDNSAPMLATARAEGEPSADYLLADARDYDPAPARPDLIVSNATLQWIDGHLDLVPRWAGALRPGGVVAFQVPGNFEAPSHTLLAELRRSPRWRDLLGEDAVRAGVHPPERYLDALAGADCLPDVWETTYSTLLPGPDPVLEWVKGSALRPVLGLLADPAERAAFLAEYGRLLREAYPAGPYGTVFPFRRIFAVGIRR
ncbi:trans-aconitate 2-methyltransferase [Streptomyces sp. 1114.5]|uniref:methyltransferase domain-containing protein n=1 Tax=unclassified Streptomyces TaxID=2593676 RepID=UPI000BD840B1|nr:MULTISPECIES: methyltransferase domain-containing protein [unclassified Streptomyces]RKT16215.1 trans-aconitate 2-methyltransferase [Streptomyces sp. 1114.5]SOB82387.1 trans-aconitate 2-methyltransferase [Streptomyces sp. 1331.2]